MHRYQNQWDFSDKIHDAVQRHKDRELKTTLQDDQQEYGLEHQKRQIHSAENIAYTNADNVRFGLENQYDLGLKNWGVSRDMADISQDRYSRQTTAEDEYSNLARKAMINAENKRKWGVGKDEALSGFTLYNASESFGELFDWMPLGTDTFFQDQAGSGIYDYLNPAPVSEQYIPSVVNPEIMNLYQGYGGEQAPPSNEQLIEDFNRFIMQESYGKQYGGPINEEYKSGGKLSGNKKGDRGNYALEDGEYVLNRNAVKGLENEFGKGFLNYVNDKAFPRKGLQHGGNVQKKSLSYTPIHAQNDFMEDGLYNTNQLLSISPEQVGGNIGDGRRYYLGEGRSRSNSLADTKASFDARGKMAFSPSDSLTTPQAMDMFPRYFGIEPEEIEKPKKKGLFGRLGFQSGGIVDSSSTFSDGSSSFKNGKPTMPSAGSSMKARGLLAYLPSHPKTYKI